MADDMGWAQTSYYGHPILKTPNLDQWHPTACVWIVLRWRAKLHAHSCISTNGPHNVALAFKVVSP